MRWLFSQKQIVSGVLHELSVALCRGNARIEQSICIVVIHPATNFTRLLRVGPSCRVWHSRRRSPWLMLRVLDVFVSAGGLVGVAVCWSWFWLLLWVLEGFLLAAALGAFRAPVLCVMCAGFHYLQVPWRLL